MCIDLLIPILFFLFQVTATVPQLTLPQLTKTIISKNLTVQEYGMALHLVDMSPDPLMLQMNLLKLQ